VRSEGLDVVCFGAVDWSGTWQRPQQLASRLAAHGRVVYVDPLGLRRARWTDAARLARRVTAPRRGRSLVEVVRPTRAAVASGMGAPVDWASRLLERDVGRALVKAGITRPLVWVGTPHPVVRALLDRNPARLLVYDCMDAVEAFPSVPAGVEEVEDDLARRADLVLATSRILEERMRRLNPRTLRVSNAADYAHFSRPIPTAEIPRETAALPHPMVGYIGEVADWLDVDLVLSMARRQPRWSIVLVGPVAPGMAWRLDAPNVHLLGRRPYADLPAFAAGFDVCIIPFRATVLTAAVNPVKLYEYLATGKPVVSTPLPEVLPFAGPVTVGAGVTFLEAVEHVVSTPASPPAVEARRRIARENTWEARIEAILGGLAEVARARRPAPAEEETG
jgi:glycosyltransferase involved in cell wall biosynthesis